MQIRRIVISLREGWRIIVYPEGGCEVEAFVKGPGWVIANTDDMSHSECNEIIALAARHLAVSGGKLEAVANGT